MEIRTEQEGKWISPMYGKFLSTDGSLTFANAYPCVLVDGYARALKNESTGSFTTIKHNNTGIQDSLHLTSLLRCNQIRKER